MKKILLITFLIFFSLNSNAQNFKTLFNKVEKFKTQEEFDSVDKDILEAINYLLTHKYKEKTENYFYALKSMIDWMDGTSKYAIILGGKISDDIGTNNLMVNMYMASMAKYLLEERFNKNRYIDVQKQKDKKFMERDNFREIQLNGAKILFNYIENYAETKINKKLKKAVRAYKKDKLYEYMYN